VESIVTLKLAPEKPLGEHGLALRDRAFWAWQAGTPAGV